MTTAERIAEFKQASNVATNGNYVRFDTVRQLRDFLACFDDDAPIGTGHTGAEGALQANWIETGVGEADHPTFGIYRAGPARKPVTPVLSVEPVEEERYLGFYGMFPNDVDLLISSPSEAGAVDFVRNWAGRDTIPDPDGEKSGFVLKAAVGAFRIRRRPDREGVRKGV